MVNLRREFFVQSGLAMKSGEYDKAFGKLRGRKYGTDEFQHCGLGVMADVSIKNDPDSIYRWDDGLQSSSLVGEVTSERAPRIVDDPTFWMQFDDWDEDEGDYVPRDVHYFDSSGGIGNFVYKGEWVMNEGLPHRTDGRAGWTVSQDFWYNLPDRVRSVIQQDFRVQDDGTVDIIASIPQLNDWRTAYTDHPDDDQHITLQEIGSIVLEHARIMEPEDPDALLPDLKVAEPSDEQIMNLIVEQEKETVS